MERELNARSNGECELCGSKSGLTPYLVAPKTGNSANDFTMVCEACQMHLSDDSDSNYWRCLNDSVWTEVPAVKALIWRILNKHQEKGWPADLRDMMYLDEETQEWAAASDSAIKHVDSNGALLENGDTVTLIKDLDVKGANFTAKRGTAVRNIRLVHDNASQLEGKVNGQSIIILTQYVKK